MANKVLTIDLDKLQESIGKYETIITAFEDAIVKADKALAVLKSSGWKSGASSAYFQHYEDTWKKNMRKKIDIIKHLKSCLEKAKTEYNNVNSEFQKIRLTID